MPLASTSVSSTPIMPATRKTGAFAGAPTGDATRVSTSPDCSRARRKSAAIAPVSSAPTPSAFGETSRNSTPASTGFGGGGGDLR